MHETLQPEARDVLFWKSMNTSLAILERKNLGRLSGIGQQTCHFGCRKWGHNEFFFLLFLNRLMDKILRRIASRLCNLYFLFIEYWRTSEWFNGRKEVWNEENMLPNTEFAVLFLGTVLMDNKFYLNTLVHTWNFQMLHFGYAIARE